MKYVTPENHAPDTASLAPFEGVSEGPGWVIGQQVSGDDYVRLPINSAVSKAYWPTRTKIAPNQWRSDVDPEDVVGDSGMQAVRTLIRLGEATEPESPPAGVELGEFIRNGEVIATAKLGPVQPINTEHILAFKIEPTAENLAKVEAALDAIGPPESKVTRIEALLDAEIAETIEARVRAARGDVRCLDCNLRYDERQEYGCHESGRGHSYSEGDLAGAEEIERSNPVEYVTLSVADLRAALDTEASGD